MKKIKCILQVGLVLSSIKKKKKIVGSRGIWLWFCWVSINNFPSTKKIMTTVCFGFVLSASNGFQCS